MLSTLVLISSAHAFCGTYTGSPGDELINETSRVVLAVDPLADTTTLTLDMDVSGADRDFGLVIPVPSGLDATSVTTVDRALLESLVRQGQLPAFARLMQQGVVVDMAVCVGFGRACQRAVGEECSAAATFRDAAVRQFVRPGRLRT